MGSVPIEADLEVVVAADSEAVAEGSVGDSVVVGKILEAGEAASAEAIGEFYQCDALLF